MVIKKLFLFVITVVLVQERRKIRECWYQKCLFSEEIFSFDPQTSIILLKKKVIDRLLLSLSLTINLIIS